MQNDVHGWKRTAGILHSVTLAGVFNQLTVSVDSDLYAFDVINYSINLSAWGWACLKDSEHADANSDEPLSDVKHFDSLISEDSKDCAV